MLAGLGYFDFDFDLLVMATQKVTATFMYLHISDVSLSLFLVFLCLFLFLRFLSVSYVQRVHTICLVEVSFGCWDNNDRLSMMWTA